MELRIQVGSDEVWAEHLAGDGVPVVLVDLDSRVWDTVVAELAGRRVVRYDVRGYGRSAAATGEFSLLGDLKTVLDQLGLEQVVLVGCSSGGGTAIGLALEQPERVRGLVLLGPDVPGFPWPHKDLKEPEYVQDPPIYDRLHEVRAPSIVMVGEDDRTIVAAVAGTTAARIPDCELVWMPGVDHLPSSAPGLVADTIQRVANE